MYLFDSRSVQPFMRQLVAGTTEPTPTKQPQPVAAEQESTKTEEKPAEKPTSKTPLLDNSFMDKSLPVNTGVNARMVVIDKQESNNQDTDNKPKFSKSSAVGDRTITQVRDKLISRFGKRIVEQLESKGILKIHQSIDDNSVPKEVRLSGIDEGFYFNGTVHLIADNLTDETISYTLVGNKYRIDSINWALI